MKIVFLSDDFPPQSFGGAGISTYDLAVGMKKAGHDVSVITTCREKKDAGEVEYSGLRIFKIASSYAGKWRWYVSLWNPPVVRQVAYILAEIQPDVVHVNNIHFYLSYRSIAVAKKYAKSVVFTARDVMAFNFAKLQTKQYLEHFSYKTTWRDHVAQAKKRWNPLRNFFIRKYLARADGRFAVSFALKKALEENGITDVGVVHTGADLSEWKVSTDNATGVEGAVFRKKYGLENKKVILFGGRLSEAKGGNKVLEAMTVVVKKFPDAVLVVVASHDGHTESMAEVAKNMGIGAELVFTGWMGREDMKSAYAGSDIVLVPSICFDSFPRTVLEAMAVGKPVLGTCYGGTSEIIEDGVTGYVINPFQAQNMAEKIIELLSDTAKRERFGKAARERVEKSFDLNDKISEYVEHYKKAMARNS